MRRSASSSGVVSTTKSTPLWQNKSPFSQETQDDQTTQNLAHHRAFLDICARWTQRSSARTNPHEASIYSSFRPTTCATKSPSVSRDVACLLSPGKSTTQKSPPRGAYAYPTTTHCTRTFSAGNTAPYTNLLQLCQTTTHTETTKEVASIVETSSKV